MNDCAPYSLIERPQNPFDKNFEINRNSPERALALNRKSSLSTEFNDNNTRLFSNNSEQKPNTVVRSLLNLCPVEQSADANNLL